MAIYSVKEEKVYLLSEYSFTLQIVRQLRAATSCDSSLDMESTAKEHFPNPVTQFMLAGNVTENQLE